MKNPLMHTLSLQVTYQCNIACRHCGPYCDPYEKDWMTTEEIRGLIRASADMGTTTVVFTGGEPSLLKGDLPRLLRFIHEDMNIPNSRIVSNAKFAGSYEKARALLASWQDAGLREVNFSCGEYHQEFVPIEYIGNAYRASVDLGFHTVLLAGEFLDVGGKLSPEVFEEQLGIPLMNVDQASPYSEVFHGLTRSAAMPYGRGKREVPCDKLRFVPESQIQSTCKDVMRVITAHPNGNTTACCGIMTRDESLLHIGNWRATPFREIVERAQDDLILNWIAYRGLRDMKAWLESKDSSLGLRKEYQNICDLCAELVYNERCQELLLEHGHEKRNELIAAKLAIEAVECSSDFVYGPAAPESVGFT